ncbi:Facilitated trehalose transporter Tret1 [Orchesella cincta]|uniref:Facilitated trehalose transporter Tret1 n=1 Tax=Orchesella cincta TaxID=48709 RepID=A0A1D2MN77_ORCCI|nr:Facilitated trehalose transporter Tret1 [Orchesella cincta]
MDCETDTAETVMLPRKEFPDADAKWYQIMAALAVCYICICGGNISGFTSPAIPSMRQVGYREESLCSNSSLLSTDVAASNNSLAERPENMSTCVEMIVEEQVEFLNITDSQASWIGGLAPLGAFVGSMAATISVKLLGPKGSILFLGSPIFLVSWVITALAPSILVVYIGRFIGGIALGLTISAAPLYIVESASVELRGPLGTLTQFLFTFGVLTSFIFGSILNWRQLAWASATIVLPSILMLFLIPESPVWLLSKDRVKEAERAFYKLRGKSADFKSFLECNAKLHNIDVNMNSDGIRSGISFFWKLNKAERRSCLVAIALCVFQQLSGINGINYYALTIFKAASEGSEAFVLNGHVSSIIVASVFCLATLPSYLLIEKVGRKLLLIGSIILMAFSSFGIGIYFFIKEKVEDSGVFRMIPLILLIIFVLAFSSGFGPILYILVAEILSPEIRPIYSPIAVGINWLAVFAITKSFPDLIAITGIYGVFWLYASLTIVAVFFVICFVPETKGKSEREIEKYFW